MLTVAFLLKSQALFLYLMLSFSLTADTEGCEHNWRKFTATATGTSPADTRGKTRRRTAESTAVTWPASIPHKSRTSLMVSIRVHPRQSHKNTSVTKNKLTVQTFKSLGLVRFIVFAHQGCIHLIENTVKL